MASVPRPPSSAPPVRLQAEEVKSHQHRRKTESYDSFRSITHALGVIRNQVEAGIASHKLLISFFEKMVNARSKYISAMTKVYNSTNEKAQLKTVMLDGSMRHDVPDTKGDDGDSKDDGGSDGNDVGVGEKPEDKPEELPVNEKSGRAVRGKGALSKGVDQMRSFGTSFDLCLSHLHEGLELDRVYCQRLREQVIAPLKESLRSAEERKKEAYKDESSFNSDVANVRDGIRKMRSSCIKALNTLASAEAAAKRRAEEDQGDGKAKKSGLFSRFVRGIRSFQSVNTDDAREKAVKQLGDYERLIANSNRSLVQSYEYDLPAVVETLRSIEEQRLDCVERVLRSYNTSVGEYSLALPRKAKVLSESTIETQRDILDFVAQVLHERGKALKTPPFEYDLHISASSLVGSDGEPTEVGKSAFGLNLADFERFYPQNEDGQEPRSRTRSMLGRLANWVGGSGGRDSKNEEAEGKSGDDDVSGTGEGSEGKQVGASVHFDLRRQQPRALSMLVQSLISAKCTERKGIFRVAPSQQLTNMIREVGEQGDYEGFARILMRAASGSLGAGMCEHPADGPAAVLKSWLRSLAEPTIPNAFYEECVQLATKHQDLGEEAGTEEALESLYDRLPSANRSVLSVLAWLMRQIVVNRQENLMGVENLALIWAPCLMRNPSDDPMVLLHNAKLETLFCRLLFQMIMDNVLKPEQSSESVTYEHSDGESRSRGQSVSYVDNQDEEDRPVDEPSETVDVDDDGDEDDASEKRDQGSAPAGSEDEPSKTVDVDDDVDEDDASEKRDQGSAPAGPDESEEGNAHSVKDPFDDQEVRDLFGEDPVEGADPDGDEALLDTADFE